MLPFLSLRTFHIKGPFGFHLTLGTDRVSKVVHQRSSDQVPLDNSTAEIPTTTQPTPTLSRPPSLAPTECVPEELTQEEIVVDIQAKGIKVRDFAYEKHSKDLKLIPEFFDPDKALGEHDYRLTNNPRRKPISGRIARRLLDVGWVTMAEAKRRWHQMDWDALAEYDSRPPYPWTVKKVPFPSEEQRRALCFTVGRFLETLEDQLQRMADADATAAARAEADICPPIPQPEPVVFPVEAPLTPPCPRGEKRALDGDDGEGEDTTELCERSRSLSSLKRRKLRNDNQNAAPLSRSSSQVVPPKQYPAPRNAYASSIRSLIPDSSVASCSAEASAMPMHPTPSTVSIRQKGLKRNSTITNVQ